MLTFEIISVFFLCFFRIISMFQIQYFSAVTISIRVNYEKIYNRSVHIHMHTYMRLIAQMFIIL